MNDLAAVEARLQEAHKMSSELAHDLLTYLIQCALVEVEDIRSGARTRSAEGMAKPSKS